MSRSRVGLLGGPVFFVLWFIGAQTLFFATGGTMDESPLPTPVEFPSVVLTHQSSVFLGATLLLSAAAALLWFAAGLRDRAGSTSALGLVAVLGATGVAILLVLQGGLAVASVNIAEDTPESSWLVFKLSGAVGFESLGSTFLGAVTVTGVLAASSRNTVPRWFWWLTAVFGAVLIVGAILEGFGVVPDGRFPIFFGLWAFIAGFALLADPASGHSGSD
jgi:hypothetical protein